MNEPKKYGIIAGVVTVAYFLLFYIIDRTLILNMKVYWSSFLIYFACMYSACIAIRRKNENEVLHLPEALKAAFVVFLIANAIFYVFYYVLLNFVDPGLVDLQREVAQQMYHDYLPEDQANEMTKNMTEEGFDMTIQRSVFEYAKGAIVGFAFSLLIGAMTRQE